MTKEKALSEKKQFIGWGIYGYVDEDVTEAVERLKKRGLKRTLYPKYLMLTKSDLDEIFGDLQ